MEMRAVRRRLENLLVGSGQVGRQAEEGAGGSADLLRKVRVDLSRSQEIAFFFQLLLTFVSRCEWDTRKHGLCAVYSESHGFHVQAAPHSGQRCSTTRKAKAARLSPPARTQESMGVLTGAAALPAATGLCS